MKPERRVLITAGPTREPLDPVRFISNASSGAQGVALAQEALDRGWGVDLVHGPIQVPPPAGATAHAVTTTDEMLARCLALHAAVDAVIAAAAVCDFRPRSVEDTKQKRTAPWTLELLPTPDILEKLGERKEGRVHVGFALETADLVSNASDKLRRKNLDWIVANTPRAIGAALGDYVLVGTGGVCFDLGTLSKKDLAARLFARIEAMLES